MPPLSPTSSRRNFYHEHRALDSPSRRFRPDLLLGLLFGLGNGSDGGLARAPSVLREEWRQPRDRRSGPDREEGQADRRPSHRQQSRQHPRLLAGDDRLSRPFRRSRRGLCDDRHDDPRRHLRRGPAEIGGDRLAGRLCSQGVASGFDRRRRARAADANHQLDRAAASRLDRRRARFVGLAADGP